MKSILKRKLLYIIILFSFGCINPSEESKEHSEVEEKVVEKDSLSDIGTDKELVIVRSLKELSIVDNNQSYEDVKTLINSQRLELQAADVSLDSISKIFTSSLVNKIMPFWEGTDWSFGGHTSVPNSGYIACGYFVSTTLQDLGLNINRYKLAQQSPFYEAKTLALNSTIHEISEGSNSENISAIDEVIESGIHFIGFDQSHVGFLFKEDNRMYLIHSNYVDPFEVEMELLEESEVFHSYSKYYLVELSTNKEMMERWTSGRRLEVVIEK